MSAPPSAADPALDAVVRREGRSLVAAVLHVVGAARLDLAEDVAQDALLAAMTHWPWHGVPDDPGAWLRRVARNRALDRLRHEGHERRHREAVGAEPEAGVVPAALPEHAVEDDELRLLLLCAHPALGEWERVALSLNLACGFTAREIARLVFSAEAAVAQRLVRAKQRLREAGADFELAFDGDLAARRGGAIKAIYLMFSLGYAPGEGDRSVRHEVLGEALRLAETLAAHRALADGECAALAALLCFQHARAATRVDQDGNYVPLPSQDRARWDAATIARGLGWLRQAMRADALSALHVEAGIASLHATARDWAATDWAAIRAAYDTLQAITGSPVVAINRAVAQCFAGDAEGALAVLDRIAGGGDLDRHAPLHAARAEVLARLGRRAAAETAWRAAAACPLAAPELRYFEHRLAAAD